MPIRNFDHYYDPPEQDETCRICHHNPDDCTCPECEKCGVQGDPACINVHMPWSKWGHFHFQPTEKEREEERKAEETLAEQEKKMWEYLDGHN